jgi:hypothetical protein
VGKTNESGMRRAVSRDGVVETLFRELLQMSDEDVAAFKAAESWPRRVAAAHTISREIRGESAARVVNLDNEGHVADVLAPEAFAEQLVAWLRDVR